MNDRDAATCVKCGTELSAIERLSEIEPSFQQPSVPGGAPTLRGKGADVPAWDVPQNDDGSSSSSIQHASEKNMAKCPSCGFYPIRNNVSTETPCPNCGFEGHAEAPQEDHAGDSPSKTMNLGAINFGEKAMTVVLRDDKTGEAVTFKKSINKLNRRALDSENQSISTEVHAVLKIENDHVILEDKSSNGATFVQVTSPQVITDKSRIILGNKIFTVEIDS
ncbi:MAG: FHA domain-containing protein [Bacteroidales bacterium]|nr:FHA domain-containing protein [Bacteroidales bacterium]MCF8333706.1 FHA domain-containing protein [Bacteroidales bacterium]